MFPGSYFGLFLAVAVQFSIINTVKKFGDAESGGVICIQVQKRHAYHQNNWVLLLPKIVSGNDTPASECKTESSMRQTITQTGFVANTQKLHKCQGWPIA